jgi:Helicase conserved C-terminal domain
MDTPSAIQSASAFDFQRDLSRYWRHVRKQGGVALTAQGWIYKSNFKSFLAALNIPAGLLNNEEQTNAKLWFMRRLLVQMREMQGDNFGEAININPNGKLLSMSMAQRVRWAFESWRDGGAWNELIRLPGQNVSFDHRREAPPGLAKSRGVVLRVMGRLSAGQVTQWQSVAALIAQIKKSEYQFLFERKRGYGVGGMFSSPYYSSNNPYGISFSVARDEASGWDVVERAFIIELLTGPLHWLGLIDLGSTGVVAPGVPNGEQPEPQSYRLTEVGAWLLGVGEQPNFVETGGRVVVQPNFTVLAMEPISDAVLVDLDHFADSQGGDRAITYEITRESLYRGQRSGWSAERVIALLEKHQGTPVPLNVKRTLEEWESTHRRITFHRRKLVVQFADDDAELQASLALAPFKPHALGERFELIGNGDVDKVISALRETGWMPTLQAEGQTGVENSVRADEDGTLTFTQPAPSVHTLGRLVQFAETSPYRITAVSVRDAMNNALDVEQVLATLAEMHAGQVPAGLEKTIRQWAGFFGTAAIRNVVLLELSNVDVMANLLGDPLVGPYLTLIEGSSKPLAIIRPEHVDAVRAVLVERGVAI